MRAYQDAADPLQVLKCSQRIREAAEELEACAIHEARDQGVTWRDIGACYGLSKQGAQQRFKIGAAQGPQSAHRKPTR